MLFTEFSGDDSRVVAIQSDSTTRSFDATSGKQLALSERDHGQVAAVTADGTIVVNSQSTSDTLSASLTIIESGEEITALPVRPMKISRFAFDSVGSRLALISATNVLEVFDAHDGSSLATFTGVSDLKAPIFSPDGRTVAAFGDKSGVIVILSIDTGKLVATITSDQFFEDMVFSPDGRSVATFSLLDENLVSIWSASTGKIVTVLSGTTTPLHVIEFSPAGDKIATGNSDGSTNIFDVASSNIVTTVTGHSLYVDDVSFSPDGTRLVTASADGTAKLWSAQNGALLATLDGHGSGVDWAVFNHSGDRVLTATHDGIGIIWAAA